MCYIADASICGKCICELLFASMRDFYDADVFRQKKRIGCFFLLFANVSLSAKIAAYCLGVFKIIWLQAYMRWDLFRKRARLEKHSNKLKRNIHKERGTIHLIIVNTDCNIATYLISVSPTVPWVCSVQMKIRSKNSSLMDDCGKLFNCITSHGSESIMTELLWHFSLYTYLTTNSPWCVM